MKSGVQNRTAGLMIVVVLALVQSAIGVLRVLYCINVGSDLIGRGLLLLPLMGAMSYFRGGFDAVLALLYVVFAYGAFLGRSWARWLGIALAAVTLLLVVNVVLQGESAALALVFTIVPVVMLWYLNSVAGRQVLAADSHAQ